MRKGFAPLLVLVVIAVILTAVGAIAYLQFKPKSAPQSQSTTTPQSTPVAQSISAPDETANWKTYANTKYNFSFKYPPEWIFEPEVIEAYPEQNVVVLSKNYNEIVLGITENIESVPEAKKAIYRERAESLNFEFGDTKIGNLIFKVPVFSEGKVPEQEGEWLSFIIHKNILYAFSIDTDNPDEDFETFNQILSTFRFD